MNSVQIPLASGFKALVGVLTGKEQRILTKDDGRSSNEKIQELLVSLVHSIGEIDLAQLSIKEKDELFNKIPSCDRASLLVGIRLASLPGENKFNFDYKYTNQERKEVIDPKEFDLSGGFPMFPIKHYDLEQYRDVHTVSDFKKRLEELPDAEFSSYAELLDNLNVVGILPDSKLRFSFTMLNQTGEMIGVNTKKGDRSSHTILLMRNPVYYLEDKSTPIRFTERDLDKLSLTDIEYMRTLMKFVEGRVDTEVMFEHPEARYKERHEKQVIINLIGEVSFFFPSGAI